MRNLGSHGRTTDGPLFEHLEARKLLSISYVEQPVPGNAQTEAVFADFDADGDIDVAFFEQFHYSTSILKVRLNNGSGQFGAVSEYLMPTATNTSFSLNFTTGDFNADGALDIVMGFLSGPGIFVPGQGDGTFGTPAVIDELLSARSMWTTDFSGDGIDDIVVDGTDFMRLLESNGDGTFRIAADLTRGIAGSGIIAVEDFDGDEIADIAINGIDSLQVWFGGGGGFTAGPVSSAGRNTTVGDFNGDGLADLAWSNSWAPNRVHVALNPGDGRFDAPTLVYTSLINSVHWSAQAVDIDGDGSMDLVFHGYWGEYGVLLGDNAGGFVSETALFSIALNGGLAESVSLIQWADTTGDGAPEAFIFTYKPGAGETPLKWSFASRMDPPTIGSVAGPTGPALPGSLLTITASDVIASAGRTIASVRVFADTNGNGRYDNNSFGSGPDLLFGSAVPDGMHQWSMNEVVQDSQFGESSRFFIIATDSDDIASDEASVDVEFWSRVFYPDGWRSDATATETLSLANPSDDEVAYRVVARYETGAREEVIAQGVLAPYASLQITLSERGNPAAALVRAHVGYALEVQSNSAIGATLVREDNFGVLGQADRTTVAEALNAQSADRWGFADVSTQSNDFLLFYNSFERDIMVRIEFTHETLDPLVVWQSLEGLRRGGLNLSQIAALTPDESYSVEITADGSFAAAISRYTDSGGMGFTSLGQQQQRTNTFNWVELGTGTISSLAVFNPANEANNVPEITVDIQMTFNDPSATVHIEQVTIAAGSRVNLDLNSFAPTGATFAHLRVTGSAAFYSQASTTNSLIADSTQTQSPGLQASSWAFAGASFRPNQSAEWLVITNNNSVTTTVTLDLIVNGASSQRSLSISANQAVRINLSDEPSIRILSDPTSYAIVVSGNFKIIASMTHWDPVGGIGWQTLGTVTGGFILI